MPTVTNDGTTLYYEVDGSGGSAGDDDCRTVVFVEDVGLGAWLWGWQHAALAGPYETIVWDLRGTGRSDAPSGPYSVATLAADLDAVLADHGARRAHVVGAGLGGMVALRYALEYGRAKTLTLSGTSASGDGLPAVSEAELVASPDDEVSLRSSLERHLSPEFCEKFPDVTDRIVEWRREGDAGVDGWRAQMSALTEFDAIDRLYEITEPALVLHGEADAIVPVERGERLTEGLPRGEIETYPDAGHLAFVERSGFVNDRLLGFFEDA